jgi:uncharacterized protein
MTVQDTVASAEGTDRDRSVRLGADAARPYAPTWLFVLQPTNFCNINCGYCYLADRGTKNVMSHETAAAIVERVIEHRESLAKEIVFTWHAGEPLAAGIDRMAAYFAAFDRLTDHGIRYRHNVQTNAMLVTGPFAELFARHGVRVGVSIDGSQKQHDRYRRTRAGKGTFEKVVQGVRTLQARGLEPSAIAVAHEETFADPDAFYDSFVGLGLPYVGINVLELEGASRSSYLNDRAYMLRYRTFLERIFQRSIEDGRVAIRELLRALRVIVRPMSCYSSEATPGRIVTIGHGGDYATFSPELIDHHISDLGNFVIGNVHDTSFHRALTDQADRRFAIEIARGVAACRASCSYFAACGGGAPANKLVENASLASTETAFCRYTVKTVLDIATAMVVSDPGLLTRAARTKWWALVDDHGS